MAAAVIGIAIGPEILATAACADLDCTNEVSQLAPRTRSVWDLNPFQRGVEIEQRLGRTPELANNFPVIDRFENGVATSIKSLDTTAASYQSTAQLTNTVQRYINTLANWHGQASPWGGVTIRATQIQQRVLELAIPPGTSDAQYKALQELQQGAPNVGVQLQIVVVQ
jgi:filamentous hemagglutinin